LFSFDDCGIQYCLKWCSRHVTNVLHFRQYQPRKQFLTSRHEILRHSGARQRQDNPYCFARRDGILYWGTEPRLVLGDRTPIPVTDASSCTEAVEFLLFTFFLFSVQYPQQLRYFYCFLAFLKAFLTCLHHCQMIYFSTAYFRKLGMYRVLCVFRTVSE